MGPGGHVRTFRFRRITAPAGRVAAEARLLGPLGRRDPQARRPLRSALLLLSQRPASPEGGA